MTCNQVSPNLILTDISTWQQILSHTGPCANFARTCRAFHEAHSIIVPLMGMQLSKQVNRTLWRTNVLPRIGTNVSPEQGLRIQQTALSKVRATWEELSAFEKQRFYGLSLQRISATPERFHEILLIADELDLMHMFDRMTLSGPERDKQKERTREERAESLAHLTKISLSNFSRRFEEDTPLTSLPESFGIASSLVSLDLSCNNLEALPKSIGKLTKLTLLSLNNNKLRFLPESFENLTALTRLCLSRNLLECLPESFAHLTSLRSLSLAENQLKRLPEMIGNLKNLAFLDLTTNNLRTLPESFGDLSSLIDLCIAGNSLESLPKSFGKLTALAQINLCFNLLRAIPETIGNFFSLTYFDLTCNPLSIPPELQNVLINYHTIGRNIFYHIEAVPGNLLIAS